MIQQARGITPGRVGSANHRPCSAFTLVELLVVIVVIGILAGVSLGALSSARETSRVAKTRATIIKIDKIVMGKYESYQYRRLPIKTSGLRPQYAAAVRLLALRDLMRMEMPERWKDVDRNPITASQTDWPGSAIHTDVNNAYLLCTNRNGVYGISRPPLSQAYQRRLAAARAPTNVTAEQITRYQSAECLYMFVTAGNPEARSEFAESEVGDADGDGLPEFHDAWGHPIHFLRWAPQFRALDSDVQTNDPKTDHDPFDPYQLEIDTTPTALRGQRLIPLIYSVGPDGIDGLEPAPDYVFGGSPYCYASGSNIVSNPAGKPLEDGSGNLLGYHFDNIHNHRLEVK